MIGVDKKMLLEKGSLEDFIKYNEEYDKDDWLKYSEARKFDLRAIEIWLSVRDGLSFIEDYERGDWRTLEIVQCGSKYGTNYVFIDIENRKWRTRETAAEFYGSIPPKFEPSQLR